MLTHQAHALGTLMCHATRDVLWQPAQSWVQSQHKAAGLVLRVGAGQATYHRFEPRRNEHLITYGARMIAAKHQAASAQGWLSTREIRKRGYFGGEVSVLNLLAHTCCHEFAHLLQYAAGKRTYGSVHNRHFYQALDQLHESGAAEATRRYLQNNARAAGVDLPEAPLALPDPQQLLLNWQVGDSVSFGEGSRKKRGRVVRVNRKTCTVEGTHESRGVRYRVPVSMLRHAH